MGAVRAQHPDLDHPKEKDAQPHPGQQSTRRVSMDAEYAEPEAGDHREDKEQVIPQLEVAGDIILESAILTGSGNTS